MPFNGATPAVNSTLAGDTQIIFLALPPIAPYLRSDKLRALAVISPARTPAFPQIPTLLESGIPDQEADLINGIVAPTGTQPEIIAVLQKQIAEIVQLPDFKATLDKLSFQPVGSTSAEFGNQIKNDIVVWSKVMKDANIPVN
jgi:tripartite-type tricarboxylate transporter receptor subunit TctC